MTGQESSQGGRVLSTEACTIMGPWLDPIPYLICSPRLPCWRRRLQRDLWRTKRLTQLYNFNWVFCAKQLLVVSWKNWPQTTIITCSRLLGKRNNYSRNRWDLRSLRFLHSKIIWSRWRLSWLWCKPRYEHNQNNTYNSHSLRCLIFEFRKTGLSCFDWSTQILNAFWISVPLPWCLETLWKRKTDLKCVLNFCAFTMMLGNTLEKKNSSMLGLASCHIFYWL